MIGNGFQWLFLLLLLAARLGSCCDIAAITKDVSKCFILPFEESSAERVDSVCKNVECNLKCIRNAVGDCYKEDALFAFEPEVMKVTYRAVCDNPNAAKVMFRECSKTDTLCLDTFTTTLANTTLSQYSKGEYAAFKTETCSAMNAVVTCLTIPVTSGCPVDAAQFTEKYITAAFSYHSCGAQQNSEFFKTYVGDITCGVDHVTMPFLPLLIVMLFFRAL